MQKKSCRVGYFDIAKGIGIIAVIMGHTIWDSPLKQCIFSFHMPLFFLISGYFFKKKETKICLKQNAKHLIIPYFFTCFCIMFSSIIVSFLLNGQEQIPANLKEWFIASLYGSGGVHEVPFHIPQIGATWFLWALFLAFLIFNNIVDTKWTMLIVATLAYIGYKTADMIWLPLSIQPALVSLLFVYFGYECKKNKLLEKKLSIWWAIVIAAIWVISFYYGGHMYLVGCYFGNGFLDIIGALCGTFIILLVSRLIERYTKYISKFLQFLGRNTLPILCFHLIELNTFPWWKVDELCNQLNYGHSVRVILVLKYLWMLIAVLIVNVIPILRNIFSLEKRGFSE